MMRTNVSAHDKTRLAALAAAAAITVMIVASGCSSPTPPRVAKSEAVAATRAAPKSTVAAEPAAPKPADPAPAPSEPKAATVAPPEPARAPRRPLPIIPGAAGFGIETPAGSGRHLMGVTLEPGWDASLVRHWSFDDGVPAGGTLIGDASIVDRNGGRALRLKGKGALELANAEGYVPAGGSFTIMAWARMDSPTGIVAQNHDGHGSNWRLGHFREGSEKWMFRVKHDGKDHHATWNHSVTEATWWHVAGTYDGQTGKLRLYVDGVLVHNGWDKSLMGVAATRSRRLTIGLGVNGMVDDVMLFKTALTQTQITSLKAYRHASYFGAQRTTVYRVTNLNTSGPGSLKAALEASGPRVVVFEVSGNIDFSPHGHLGIKNPYITVAGQTAPSPGITLKACELSIGADDVLLQHIRIRAGDLHSPEEAKRYAKSTWTQFSERDCMKVGGERVVVDHCSFSWATDENVQTRANKLTVRHCIFSEALHGSTHHKGGHSRGLLMMNQSGKGNRREGQELAVIGNLFAHNKARNPTVNGGATAVVANNLLYGGKVGLKCDDSRRNYTLYSATGNVLKKMSQVMVARASFPESRIYFAPDNLFNGERYASVAEVWQHVMTPFAPGVIEEARATSAPITVPGLEVLPAEQVGKWVLECAGARPADRDPVDARVVRQVREGTGTILASQKDVGGWPELAENRRELTLPENPDGDDDGDGYTNLEEWLHGYAEEVEGKKGMAAGNVIHSKDLGWKAGQDVTAEFAALLASGKLKAGDELVLDHTYRVSGTHRLPDGVTLSAQKGAGFEVTDAKVHKPLLELGNETTLDNLAIVYLNTPEMGGRSYKHGVDFFDKRAISVSGKKDILIKDCRLEGMISNHICISDCTRPKVIGCHIIGGFWAVTISGKDLLFRDCLFEKSCCDCIKGGADGALFENCVFQDTCRDGIDTTGGLNDTIIRNCTFRRLGCTALDLKSHFSKDLGRPKNVGILIEKCLFHDIPNGIVFTTLDDVFRKTGKALLTAANMKKYAPHDIDINDCTFGHVEKPLRPSVFGKDMDPDTYGYGVMYPQEGEHMRLILLKDAYDIRYKDARVFGDRIMPVYIRSVGGSKALSKEAAQAIEPTISGNILDEPAPAPKPGVTAVPFACGPQ